MMPLIITLNVILIIGEINKRLKIADSQIFLILIKITPLLEVISSLGSLNKFKHLDSMELESTQHLKFQKIFGGNMLNLLVSSKLEKSLMVILGTYQVIKVKLWIQLSTILFILQ